MTDILSCCLQSLDVTPESFSTVSRQYFHHIWLMRADLFAIPRLENPLDTFLIPNFLGFFLALEAQTSLAPGLLLVSH